jgi:hypothetical protein
MTTPYAISRNIGSQTFQGFVHAPIRGPLNSSQYPHTLPPHHSAVLNGIRPTPPQFYPSQEPIYSDMSTLSRAKYVRGTTRLNQKKSMLYPMSASMHINAKKTDAIGKSAYKVGLPMEAPLSSKNVDNNVSKSAIRRMRSSGSSAPAKKGSIYR